IAAGDLTYSTPTLETISVTLDDLGNTGGGSQTDSANVEIVINSPPTVTAGNTVGFTERGADVVIDDQLILADSDNANLDHATVTIGGSASSDQLFVSGVQSGTVNGLTVSWDDTGKVLTLTGTASVQIYQDTLRTVAFSNPNDHNPTIYGIAPDRTISW